MNSRFVFGLLVAAHVMLGGASVAQAETIVSSPDSNTYLNGPFEQTAGEIPDYVNPPDGLGYHNVVASDEGPDGEPLFSSAAIQPGESSPVVGAQYLDAGTYHFVCTIHPGMEDDLIVTGGTPAARPEIKVSIPSQKLKRVRKSGKLKVDVKGVKEANDVDLAVSKGKEIIGTALSLSIPTGKTRTISVALTSPGKKAIKKGKKVVLAVQGSLSFGAPVTAKRTLR
jgi:plastocyanin